MTATTAPDVIADAAEILRRARDLALPANLVVIPRRNAHHHEPESGPWSVMRRTDGRLVFIAERQTPEAVLALVRRAARSTAGAPHP